MATGEYKPLHQVVPYLFIGFLVAVVTAVVGYQMWVTSSTVPIAVSEGFAGPLHMAGIPDCIQNSGDAALLYSTFSSKSSTTEEGADDLRELAVLLGKLACLKRDLMSAGHLVAATRGQPFYTTQDLEPIAETAARCFALTIPPRDIDIAVDKWRERGVMLVKRLCTSYSLNSEDSNTTTVLFKKFMDDIADVMKTVCLKGNSSIAGIPTPRMVDGKEPGENMYFSEYKGYY